MSDHSPSPVSPPRLIACVLIFVLSIVGAFVFAKAFKNAPAGLGDAALCGDTAAEGTSAADPHTVHGNSTAEPVYYAGGIWSPQHGLGPTLDAAMLIIAAQKPIVCQSAIADGESVILIDRSPIQLSSTQAASTDNKPTLVLSIDYAGSTSSMAFAAAGALQKYITEQQPNYALILVVEPLPGPTRDPDEDWTYLNFNGDENIEFFTPKRKAKPADVALALFNELGGSVSASDDIAALFEQLGSDDNTKAAAARLHLAKQSPYQVIPRLDAWLSAADNQDREARLYESLMIRRAMGVHADTVIAEAAASENAQLRALAARTIGDLASVTTNPIGRLTPLAEDDDMAVRYEALIATRAMPGRRAAGVAELVEPYEMTDAMRAVYNGTMNEMLAYGQPVPADSRANRLRRMAISELLKEDRGALVCTILLERTDLPDNKIDEVLGQLAEINGQGPLTSLLNALETMNPRTLAKREVLLKKLVDWKTNELEAQAPRLKEMALGNGTDNLRSAAAAALLQANGNQAVQLLGIRPILFKALDWDTTPKLATFLAPVIVQTALTPTNAKTDTRIAALAVFDKVPADVISAEQVDALLKLARSASEVDLRFAAIRAIGALPASRKPDGIDDLTLTAIEVRAKAGMKYDLEKLTVTAGRPVELTFINPDTMEHNLVITLPGRAQEIGVAMSADPTAAAAIGYVPKDSDAVLHFTRMLKPGESQTLRFIAPTKPDNYAYVCTFPGHYGSMNGVLQVVAP